VDRAISLQAAYCLAISPITGKRETERCRGELASAKEAAEQVAVITAELQEMFREVLNHTGIFCSILSTHGDYLLVL
jgi:hypothetical protein